MDAGRAENSDMDFVQIFLLNVIQEEEFHLIYSHEC